MNNIKQQLLRYWLAMNASAFQAAVHATKAFVGLAVAHAGLNGVPVLSWQQLLCVFGFAFGWEIVNWLDGHPVDELLPERGLSQSAARKQTGAPETLTAPVPGGSLRVETTRGPVEPADSAQSPIVNRKSS
jgi:hypothetical protein